jgi:hypothetical protein
MERRRAARANQRRIQFDLFYDYRTNVPLYPAWQNFLQQRQPRAIVSGGKTTSSLPRRW